MKANVQKHKSDPLNCFKLKRYTALCIGVLWACVFSGCECSGEREFILYKFKGDLVEVKRRFDPLEQAILEIVFDRYDVPMRVVGDQVFISCAEGGNLDLMLTYSDVFSRCKEEFELDDKVCRCLPEFSFHTDSICPPEFPALSRFQKRMDSL